MQQARDYSVDGDVESDLSYLRGISLHEMLHATSRVLDNAVSRQVEKVGETGESYSAHGTTPTP
jgi:hypothetical protein